MAKDNSDNCFEAVISRAAVFNGSYLNVETLQVSLPDGRFASREIVNVKNAVAILPLDDRGVIHLVRQHRPAIGRTILEVPAGLIDQGETPEEAAIRECEEETGYKPAVLKKLIRYAQAEGYSSGFTTLFMGTSLKHTGKTKLDSTEFLELVSLPYPELMSLVKTNQIVDSKTILCALLVENEI